MSNYFDNQSKWAWDISKDHVLVTTDHGDHTHTLEITNVPIGEMVDNTGKVMGEAHRAASHDFKEGSEYKDKNEMSKKEDFLESLKVNAETRAKLDQVMREHKDNKISKKDDDGSRDRGDEGPGSQGREPGLKGGSSKTNSKVDSMKADMKANSNANLPKGQLSENGHTTNYSGKSTAPTVIAQSNSGKTASNGTNGHSTPTGSTSSGHGSSNGSSGGYGSSGGSTSGSHDGAGGNSGSGHSGADGSSGGGHGGSGGSSGGGHDGSGGGHGGH